MKHPEPLKSGDLIRVIAPSRSMSMFSKDIIDNAECAIESMGFRVSYGQHAYEVHRNMSASVSSRIKDLHDAFLDPEVKLVLTAIGGFNANELLDHIDFELVQKHPKLFCGYSDITVLGNAMLSKAGLISYSGPHFSTFAMEQGIEYTKQAFLKALTSKNNYSILPSKQWSNDAWYEDQNNRTFIPNKGFEMIQEGRAEGVIVGGNLSSFQLLFGTEYMPNLEGSIVFLETVDCNIDGVDRMFQSLMHQKGFDQVQGIVFGRFPFASKIGIKDLKEMISTKNISSIPVIANVDFGHTEPHSIFPIGGECVFSASKKCDSISILRVHI